MAGKLRFNGALSDGSPISGQWGVTKDGKVAFYSALYGTNGMAWGWLPVAGFTSNAFSGDLVWIKKQSLATRSIPAGFTNDFAVAGSVYNQFVTAAFSGATGTLTISGGELAAPLSFQVQLVAKANGTAKLVKFGSAPLIC